MTIPGGFEDNICETEVTDTSFVPGRVLERFAARMQPHAGAIVSFSGHVRVEGDQVESLFLQHYPGYTEQSITTIAHEARTRWDVLSIQIIHRFGAVFPGEAIVFVAVAAAHRRAAFEAADFLMDYLKTRAPFWKKEIGPAGTRWINPRDTDYMDAGRWHRK